MTHGPEVISPRTPSRGDLRIALASLGLLGGLLALAAALVLGAVASTGISRYFYLMVDLPGFLAVFGCACAMLVFAVLPDLRARLTALSLAALSPWHIAAAVLGLTAIGVHLVYGAYAFSMDEWMTRLQSEIFLSGTTTAIVDPEWRDYGSAMYDNFAVYDPNSGALASNYRPGMSALYAFFDLFGLGLYTSALMNALAVLLIARIATQIFPGQPEAPVIAALLLATSQQALAAALTSYAMSAHLCLNLAWLTLFLDDRLRSHMLAALIGVATAALHQIHFHLFFALPFLLTLLRPFRPRAIVIYVVVYFVGHTAILGWDWVSFNRVVAVAAEAIQTGPIAAGQSPAAPMSAKEPGLWHRFLVLANFPSLNDVLTVMVNLVRLIAWQSLALLPLLLIGRRQLIQDRTLRLLIWSIVVSTVPYPILMPDQGHGWGYRYLHGLLGVLALLAVPGWLALRRNSGKPRLTAWVTACLLISPLILIPLRALQIDARVTPYQRATVLVAAQEADVVIVDNYQVAISYDIPRNAPVSPSRPIGMNEAFLTPEQIRTLCANYKVIFLGKDDFAPLGVPVFSAVADRDAEAHAARRAALADCGT